MKHTSSELESLAVCGQATQAQLEELGTDFLSTMKADPERVHYRDVVESYEVKELGEREFEFIFSTETPDRIGDILKSSGFVLDDFKTNPAILWSHDGRSHPPIGTATKIQKSVPFKNTKALVGTVKFAPAGISPLIDTIVGLVTARVLKATSVGITFLEIKDIRDEDERERLGLGRFGVFSLKHRLKEVSIVSIGMHQEALRKGCDALLTKGIADKAGVDAFMKGASPTDEDYAESVRELCGSFKVQIPFAFEPMKVEENPELEDLFGEPESKDATGNLLTPTMTTGTNDITWSFKTVPAESVSAEKDKRIVELQEQLKRATDANIVQANAIEAMADAFATLSERVDPQGGANGSDASDGSDASAELIKDAFSDLAERATKRLDKAISKG